MTKRLFLTGALLASSFALTTGEAQAAPQDNAVRFVPAKTVVVIKTHPRHRRHHRRHNYRHN